MDTSKFRGTWTALVTPFLDDQEQGIDYQSVGVLAERQIAGGVKGILVVGTTGESPTLTDEEAEELIRQTKKIIAGRSLVMAGCGTNSTAKSVKKAIVAKRAGADCLLVVNPYYNKPTQEGLYAHFRAVAQATDLPNFLYNIKGRTAVNLETDTLMRLFADVPNIVGVKEASGDMEQIKEVGRRRPKGALLFSGDDNLTLRLIEEAGGDGVISVASNVMPKEVSGMVETALSGKIKKARELDGKLQKLFKDLFIETNPIPVKYALYRLGLCRLVYRLPMCSPSESARLAIDALLQKYRLNSQL